MTINNSLNLKAKVGYFLLAVIVIPAILVNWLIPSDSLLSHPILI